MADHAACGGCREMTRTGSPAHVLQGAWRGRLRLRAARRSPGRRVGHKANGFSPREGNAAVVAGSTQPRGQGPRKGLRFTLSSREGHDWGKSYRKAECDLTRGHGQMLQGEASGKREAGGR